MELLSELHWCCHDVTKVVIAGIAVFTLVMLFGNKRALG